MGLYQRLNWIGKISKDEKLLLQGREAYPQRYPDCDGYTIRLDDLGIVEMQKRDFDIRKYKYIKPMLTPVKMLVRETDWDRIKKDCNVPKDAKLWGLGPNYVRFGESCENCKEYQINPIGGEYDILVERVLYLYHSIELYRWNNNNDIHNLFNHTFPDVYDEYGRKYEIEYGGFYPIDNLLEDMKKLDVSFAEQYCGITQNVFYSADW